MFDIEVKPDYEALLANLRREGTPKRVHQIELYWDLEVGEAIAQRFNLMEGLTPGHPDYWRWYTIRLHRFLGYDTVPIALQLEGQVPFGAKAAARDTAGLPREGGRRWLDEGAGPVQTMEDLERFAWPDLEADSLPNIEWLDRNLPEDMCLRAGCHNVFEFVTWAMGYEKLCYAIYDQPELVDALFQQVGELLIRWCKVLLQCKRIQLFLGGDDMGFKTSTMVSARFLKAKALPWHKRLAQLCHRQGRLYGLHACGNLDEIMEDLIEEVKLDARHSFEDTIEPITVAKKRWGQRIALLGGIDVDFLCRSTEAQVRKRVRDTLDVCLPGGGYCLGTGNTVANYVPLDNYLAMLDAGRRYTA